MTELMSFEEFLKENEKTAKTYAKQSDKRRQQESRVE